jgi:hypothetical protein
MATAKHGFVNTNIEVAEQSGATGFVFAFTDADGDALTPDSITARIINRDGTTIRALGSVPPASSVTIVPTAEDNTLVAGEGTLRGILLEWTETTDVGSALPNKVEAWYRVQDLKGVS